MDGPRQWQEKWFRIIRDHLSNPKTRHKVLQIAIASGNGIGKSSFLGMLTNWAMSTHALARGTITANTDTQMRTKTSPEIAKWTRLSITSHWFDVQAMSIKVRDRGNEERWKTDFVPWSEHNKEAFQGLHNLHKLLFIFMDEASNIHDKIWEAVEGSLTDPETVIIWVVVGNPTQNAGRFRECFRKFRHRWLTDQIDTRTVPGALTDKHREWIADYGLESDFVKVRLLGQFPAASAKQFISSADVDAAFGRHLRREQYNFAPVILGVDPSWTGDDEFVIYMRQGLYSNLVAKFAKNDNDVQMASIIARYETELRADAVFVDMGHGTGIVSAGQTMGRSWRLVSFAEKAIDPGCLNKRVEMWRNMRDWLKQGGAIPPDAVIQQDLIGPELIGRLDGKLQLEAKDDMKERGLPSPNRGDALALTFAYPVAKKSTIGVDDGIFAADRVEVDYRPFG